jgi:hypothetical protein
MTPKEKADKLVKRMYAVRSNSASDITLYFAKQSALVALDEMMKIAIWTDSGVLDYLTEVKEEIQKL